MRKHVEVLVIGAGPAGATAAINLAGLRNVMMADLLQTPTRKIGESLLSPARRLLSDMGLAEVLQTIGALPHYANRSVWGSEIPTEIDFLRSPDGHGWHIDRSRFESFLRAAALDRGVRLLAPARISSIHRLKDSFVVGLQSSEGEVLVEADFVIDAGGKKSPVAVRLGAKRRIDLPLLCSAVYGRDGLVEKGAGINFIEAVETGWWYTAPLPGGHRVLAFHTDVDILPVTGARSRDGLLSQAEQTIELKHLLREVRFVAEKRSFGCVASGSIIDRLGGLGWLATGDAALSFDPLSSQGLLNALFLGLAAAEASDSYLAGNHTAVAEYQGVAGGIRSSYAQGLRQTYMIEQRWPSAPFWSRRHVQP